MACSTIFAEAPFDPDLVRVASLSAPNNAVQGSSVTITATVSNGNSDRAFIDVEWTYNGASLGVDSNSVAPQSSLTLQRTIFIDSVGQNNVCADIIATAPDIGPTPN